MAEVDIERQRAEAILSQAGSNELSLTKDHIRALVGQLVDIVDVLRRTDRATKAKIYEELGIRLTYQPEQGRVLVETSPHAYTKHAGGEPITGSKPTNLAYSGRVGEGTRTIRPRIVQRRFIL